MTLTVAVSVPLVPCLQGPFPVSRAGGGKSGVARRAPFTVAGSAIGQWATVRKSCPLISSLAMPMRRMAARMALSLIGRPLLRARGKA